MSNTLKHVYESRRSVNSFKADRPLEKGLVKEIIDLAVLAPSAFNLQPWRILAVESAEGKEKLLQLANNQPKVVEAPVVLVLVGNTKGYENDNPVWRELEGMIGEEAAEGAKGAANYLYGSSEKRGLKFAESNTALLAMSIMYAAEAHGVHSHPMSGIDFDGIKATFNLKDEEEVVMLIALGYHDEEKGLYPRRARRGYEEIVLTV